MPISEDELDHGYGSSHFHSGNMSKAEQRRVSIVVSFLEDNIYCNLLLLVLVAFRLYNYLSLMLLPFLHSPIGDRQIIVIYNGSKAFFLSSSKTPCVPYPLDLKKWLSSCNDLHYVCEFTRNRMN